MPGDSPLIRNPSGFLWGAAVRAAGRHRFKFSLRCESSFKECVRTGLEIYKVGLYEFTERKNEAQSNVEKLVRTMVRAQLEKDSTADILDDWTISYALYEGKLCPGLWPIC